MKRIKRNSKEQYEDNKMISSVIQLVNKYSHVPLSADDIVFNMKGVFVFTKINVYDLMRFLDLKAIFNNDDCVYVTSPEGYITIHIKRKKFSSYFAYGLVLWMTAVGYIIFRHMVIHQFQNNLSYILEWIT